jgi:hypothetical protein
MMNMAGIKLALPNWTFSSGFEGRSITVTTTAQLDAAMELIGRQGGGTILLDGNGGPYAIAAKGFGSANSPIILAPLNPNNPPDVTSVNFNNVSHVAVIGMDIHGGASDRSGDVSISRSDHIALIDNKMTGTANGFMSETGTAIRGDSAGLIRNSQDITISNNTISNYNHGLGFLEIKGLQYTGNEISKMQGDGFRGGGLQDVKIAGNHFHDFYGSTQSLNHSDMIQIWGTNALTLTQNISITGNILDAGEGAATQTIFIRNEEFGQGTALINGHFKNINVSDNVVHNGAVNGIVVSDTKGVVVDSNTVLWNQHATTQTTATSAEGGSSAPRIIVNNSIGISITDNVANQIATTSGGREVTPGSNFILNYSDPNSDNYYKNHILNLSPNGDGDIRDLALRPDSPLWGKFGSSHSTISTSDTGVYAVLYQEKVAGNALALDFSAEFCLTKAGLIDTSSATAVWTFSDGRTATGWDIRHVFSKPGDYTVTLKVVDKAGQTDNIIRTIHVDDPTVFNFNFSAGAVDTSANDLDVTVKGTPLATGGAGLDGKGFHLTTGTSLTVDRGNLQIFSLDAFDINFDFRKDSATGTGGLLSLHETMSAKVISGGAIEFVRKTDEGNFKVQTATGVLADRNWHDVSFRYDGATVSIVVDGKVCGSTAASGTTAPQASWGLVVGSPWSAPVKGMIDNLSMKVPADASAAQKLSMFSQHDDNAPTHVVQADIDFSDKGADDSSFATKINIKDPLGNSFVAGREGEGFHLSGKSSFTLDRSNAHLFGLDNFDISLAFRKDAAAATGGLLNLHKTLDLTVLANNALQFKLQTDAGSFVIKSAAGALSDTAWHEIQLHFDSDAKVMSILLDGKVVASGTASGTTADASSWGLVIGDPWETSIKGVVDDFHFQAAADDASPHQTAFEAYMSYHADVPTL